jgi:hypothetical protein
VSNLLCNQRLLEISETLMSLSYLVVEIFDLESKFVYDTPCDHVLFSQPRSCFCI